MPRGRSRYQQGRVVSTAAGGWEIHYNIYLTDPQTGKAKRRHRSRVVGYRPKMRRAEAEAILAAEIAAVNGGPVARVADGTITFGDWMRNFYIPMRGARTLGPEVDPNGESSHKSHPWFGGETG
jgi:outer membrane protein assembly factor BamB